MKPLHKLKPDNEARIEWLNDSLKEKTEYAVVYLHGFSASREEGDPVHSDFAKKFGCNLYLPRLEDHGIDTTEPLAFLTADRLWNSAKESYAIGKQLGRKIILMSTSTGGTLALKLASEYPDIAGLILLSPNIAINDGFAWLLNNPWGAADSPADEGKLYSCQRHDGPVRKILELYLPDRIGGPAGRAAGINHEGIYLQESDPARFTSVLL